MGEANERRSKAMENLSLQIEKYPRDLLQRFTCGSSENTAPGEEEDSEEVELNLGLSLGGRFGIDKDAKKKLIRSSSIAGTMPLVRNDEATTLLPVSYPSLIRTSSLPTETEEEWRKRKELQTLRRMEAKRRRSEKQRNTNNSAKSEKEGCFSEEDKLQQHQQHSGGASANTMSLTVAPPFGLPTWAAAARQVVHGGGVLDVISKGKAGFLGDCGGLQGFGQPSSQGSMESQGGSSSGMSDLESKPVQGSSSCGEARSLANNQSLQERSNQDLLGSSGTSKTENTLKKPDSAENRRREIGMNTLEDMPCVFTKGDGPNGRRIEGILYRYGKGEEVRIMCVCHGKFLSPAEFVKHAGGSDVAHPLRHIVVNPSSTSFL